MWIAIFTVWMSIEPPEVTTLVPKMTYSSEEECYADAQKKEEDGIINKQENPNDAPVTITCVELRRPLHLRLQKGDPWHLRR